jgi:hypothetical protein
MSLRRLEGRYGKDLEFALISSTSPFLVASCGIFGLGFVWLGTTDRAGAKNVAWLAWGLGLFFLVLAVLTLLRLVSHRQRPYVARVGARTYTWCPADGGTGKHWQEELRRFDRTLVQTTRYARNLVVETDGRILSLFGPWSLAFADEEKFITTLERRMRLCRAGADSRDEVACAEAYLEQQQAARTVLGIAVERAKKSRTYWALDDRTDLEAALAQGLVAYVPERVHKALAELSESHDHEKNLKPLRGVD